MSGFFNSYRLQHMVMVTQVESPTKTGIPYGKIDNDPGILRISTF